MHTHTQLSTLFFLCLCRISEPDKRTQERQDTATGMAGVGRRDQRAAVTPEDLGLRLVAMASLGLSKNSKGLA